MGFRNPLVGVDTIQYYEAFNELKKINWLNVSETRYELGYFELNKFIGLFTKNPQIFIFVCATIIIVCVNFSIYKTSKNVFLSVILFQSLGFFGNSIALMRQFMAISILLISFEYFVEKKYLKTIFIVILAGMFHTTAFVFLFLYLFLYFCDKVYKLRYIITIIASSLIPILYKIVITFVPRYQFYLTYEAKEYVSRGLFVVFMIGIVLFLFIIKKNNKFLYKDRKISYLIQILIFGITANLLAKEIFMLGRIIYMFTIFSIIYIPELISILNIKINKYCFCTALILIQILYYFNFLSNSVGSICPYIFCWEV